MGATVTDPLVGKLVDGRYEIVTRIARGGMATVYLAVDRRLDRDVALKVMHPHLAEGTSGAEFISRFRREARAAARLTHPGLVAVYDQGVEDDTSYLTMEYIDGTNLRSKLVKEGSLTLADAFDVLAAVLDALAAAHRNNLVHRDIKPENVLLATDGRIKLADFGLARAVTEVTATTTGTILGTVAYLGPELIITGVGDARTDIYSAGILMFEMLVGQQPFTGESPIQVAYRHVHEDIPTPSSKINWLPVEVDELVCALAARAPENRPVDASSALELLRRTRAAISDDDLARRADVTPPTLTPPSDAGTTPEGKGSTTQPDPQDGSAPTSGRADPESGAPTTEPDADHAVAASDHETQALQLANSGTTIALPLGTVTDTAQSPTEAQAMRRARRKRRALITTTIVLVVAALITGLGLWWINVGPGAYTNVPSGLVGSSADDSSAALEQFGLHATVTTRYDDAVAKGDVIGTNPGEGERIPKDGTVELIVSRGIEKFQVPKKLVGMNQEDALAKLKDVGFEPGEPKFAYDDKVPSGVVISVSEEAGAKVPHDTEIVLTVSQGPEPVPIPQVVNSTEEAAKTTLESLGLIVDVKHSFSDDVAKGQVISQDPEAKSAAHRTDTVTIVVSKGRELVKVPDVMGMSVEDAHKALDKVDLKYDDQQAWGGFLGKVRFQGVDPGESVPKGTVVTLTIF